MIHWKWAEWFWKTKNISFLSELFPISSAEVKPLLCKSFEVFWYSSFHFWAARPWLGLGWQNAMKKAGRFFIFVLSCWNQKQKRWESHGISAFMGFLIRLCRHRWPNSSVGWFNRLQMELVGAQPFWKSGLFDLGTCIWILWPKWLSQSDRQWNSSLCKGPTQGLWTI